MVLNWRSESLRSRGTTGRDRFIEQPEYMGWFLGWLAYPLLLPVGDSSLIQSRKPKFSSSVPLSLGFLVA